MKLIVIRKSQFYVQKGQPPPPVQRTEVTVADDKKLQCHWDDQTRTLRIRDSGGAVFAAFANISEFWVDEVVTVNQTTSELEEPNVRPLTGLPAYD